MNEFKYYDIRVIPSYACGLFTLGDHIVVHGYDKFVNIGEVPWTEVCDSELLSLHASHSFTFKVVFSRVSYSLSLHSLSQIKRMHHFHRCTLFIQARRYVKTLPRSCHRTK